MVGHATDVELDGHGRLLLPPTLREFAHLDRNAMLIGQGNRFELWDEQRWNERREQWLNGDESVDVAAGGAGFAFAVIGAPNGVPSRSRAAGYTRRCSGMRRSIRSRSGPTDATWTRRSVVVVMPGKSSAGSVTRGS